MTELAVNAGVVVALSVALVLVRRFARLNAPEGHYHLGGTSRQGSSEPMYAQVTQPSSVRRRPWPTSAAAIALHERAIPTAQRA